MKYLADTSALVLVALLVLSGSAAAQGASKRFTRLKNVTPPLEVTSVAQTIATSGDAADIYYPVRPADIDARNRLKFPLVIFLQGALVDKKYYSQYARELAGYGFVVIVPNHLSSIFSDALFTEMNVINAALAHMQAESRRPESPLYRVVNTRRVGLSGHSFGSATSLFALASFCTFPFCDPEEGFQRPAEIKAAALIAGNSGEFDLDTSGVPTALLIGDLDTGLEDSAATYTTLERPKALIELTDANHYGVNDIDLPPGADERPDEAAQGLPQAISAARFARWAALFLRAHLYWDRDAWRAIYQSPGDATVSITTERQE